MPISVTSQQVLALAPDDSSAKAARSLSSPRPWSSLGQQGRAIWGACQGSGKNPYLTQVDWEGPAFKCSCPSRKFPCKHGLALLLLLAEQPNLFPEADTPDWVKNWIASRQQRAEAKDAKASKEPESTDEAARAKRTEQRAGRVSDGIDLLELWLRDLVQQGLASAPSRGFAFWDQQAARLVDAQAPGAARLVRELGSCAVASQGWQDRMLNAIGRLVLLIHGYRRMDQLPAETQADVRTTIGFTQSLEDVLSLPAVHDTWLVAGQRIEQEDRVRVQRTYLVGKETSRAALLLDFAAGTSGFKTSLIPGTAFAADLCYFPSAAPLRALIKRSHGEPQRSDRLRSAQTVAACRELIGGRIAANPWLELQPVMLKAVVPVPSPSGWVLADATGALPCMADYGLLGLSGGHPLDVVGEWDGSAVRSLAAFSNGRFAGLQVGAAAA
jgi:hypothetical protein